MCFHFQTSAPRANFVYGPCIFLKILILLEIWAPAKVFRRKTSASFINSNSSMSKVLSQKFFNRNALKVAKELIGKYLVVKIKNKEKRIW